ncbi:hypothetical protein NC651_009006 [Populus alba x Populus x berolinensis]|nr:hypothetical protein NC651_009006 [Populus alba x Populus x berolinensis]
MRFETAKQMEMIGNFKQQTDYLYFLYPSEPRRSVSLSMYSERDKTKDSDQQYSGKSKRLFKALLRLR